MEGSEEKEIKIEFCFPGKNFSAGRNTFFKDVQLACNW
jgi:hypothetical protein